MTFEKALAKKAEKGTHIKSGGFDMRVLVIPVNDFGFHQFLDRFKLIPNKIKDIDAKKYEYADGFEIAGIWTDGASVIYDLKV